MEVSSTSGNGAPFPIRDWLGCGLPEYCSKNGRDRFYGNLGNTFMPSTVQLMQLPGLTAYLSAVLPLHDHPRVLDKVALVFYHSCKDYDLASSASVGSRVYEQLDCTLFNFDEVSDVAARPVSVPMSVTVQFQGSL